MTEEKLAKQTITTSFGDIAYLAVGREDRPPVLFIHGIPTSGYLWRHVLRFLQNDFRCYAPDLMGLGDTVPAPDVRYHMEAQAEMLVEFMAKLGHERFAVVCHDQGGAAAQIIASRLPDRITCMVMTDCVCYDNWPVPVIRRLQAVMRNKLAAEMMSRTRLAERMETSQRFSSFRRGVYDPSRFSDEAIREYLRPMRDSKQGRARFREFLLAGSPKYTLLAVDGMRKFTRPTLILWAAEDRYLSPSWGKKLLEDIPGATRMELVPFCGHFWQEERPAEFASFIGGFLAEHLGAAAEAPVAKAADKKCKPPKEVHLPIVEGRA